MQRLMARMMVAATCREEDQRGQATIEYVLVLLAVASVAVVLISWAKSNQGKSGLSGLFETALNVVKKFLK